MDSILLQAIVLVLVALLIARILASLVARILASTETTNAYAKAESGAPEELRTATPVALQGKIAMYEPFSLHGQPDHVYRLADGRLVVREDKLGMASLDSALIQASVYASILRHNPPSEVGRAPVAEHGWVRIGNPERGRVRFIKVRLLTDGQLQKLVDLYWNLAGGYIPKKTNDPGVCAKRCPHFRKRCDGA